MSAHANAVRQHVFDSLVAGGMAPADARNFADTMPQQLIDMQDHPIFGEQQTTAASAADSVDVGDAPKAKRLAVIMHCAPGYEMEVHERLTLACDNIKATGVEAAPFKYCDSICATVEKSLKEGNFDGVLVWADPVSKDGERRQQLDEMLRRVSTHGVAMSTHPDLIDRMGSKAVLHETRHLSWGCQDTRLYRDMAAVRQQLFGSVTTGPRVLKLLRGSAGNGVWKVSLEDAHKALLPGGKAKLCLQSAGDDRIEEFGSRDELCARLEVLAASAIGASAGAGASGSGEAEALFVDQPFQPSVEAGMLRVYMVRETPVALLHQLPKPGGLNVSRSGLCVTEGLPDGERLYTAGHPLFDELSALLTSTWLPGLRSALQLTAAQRLPVIWDVDFLRRSSAANPPPPPREGESAFVLCEVNCSCVFPGAPLLPRIAEEARRSLEAGTFGCEILRD